MRVTQKKMLFGVAASLIAVGCSAAQTTIAQPGVERPATLPDFSGEVPRRSTLQVLIDRAIGDPGSEAEEREFQQAIADCMRARGFEYVPYVSATRWRDGGGIESVRREYGYGVSTRPSVDLPEDGGDPNVAIEASASDDEREAWGTALYGTLESVVSVNDDAGDSIEFDPNACVSVAFETGLGIDRETATQNQLRLEHLTEELDQQIATDDRSLEAWRAWATCMADAGYQAEDRGSIVADLQARLDGDTSVESVQRYELQVAAQDLECDTSSGLAITQYRVRLAYEQAFVDANPEAFAGVDRNA